MESIERNNLRKRKDNSILDQEVLDESEQDEILKTIQSQASIQSASSRKMFFVLFNFIALVFFICLMITLVNPWFISHQVAFYGIIPLWQFYSFYVLSIFCFVACGIIVKVTI